MSLFRSMQFCAGLAIMVVAESVLAQPLTLPPVDSTSPVRAALSQPAIVAPSEPDAPFVGDAQLSLARLVDEVQSRNPTLEAMLAAWQAAAQRYPQAVSLDDPMFTGIIAPGSVGSSAVETAYSLEGAQKFPWFGKRAARGRIAQAEASAAGQDVQATRLMLVEAAQMAFFDYYLAHRRQDLIASNLDVMRQFRQTAESKYRANQVTQRDVLQADVELVELERRQIELERVNTVAIARINTLLRRAPQGPLPPPPAQLSIATAALDLEQLLVVAVDQRPDVAALADRVRAEQAAVTLACKQYYPDGEVFGHYDTFWQPADTQGDLRGQVGVRLNMPIYQGRLNAAAREAMFRLSQRRAEHDQKVLDVRLEVQTAFAQLEESQKTLALYSDRMLPFVEQNVAAARANYDVGKDSFLDLATSQRQLIDVREKREEALADYHRRLAELNRAVGQPVSAMAATEDVPPPAGR